MTRRLLCSFYPAGPHPLLWISVALASVAACGGRASSADGDGELPRVDVPNTDTSGTDVPSADTSSTEVPAALRTLELRRFDENDDVSMAQPSCEYSERMKVYFRSRELITKICTEVDGSFSGTRESTPLLDTDLERIQAAYSQLQVAKSTQCENSANWLSLTVVSQHDPEDLQLLDAEHSACPFPGVEGEAFVEGLGHFYRLLAELQVE